MLRLFILNKRIVLFSSPFILAGFILALQTPTAFDSGLYHIQSIKWIEAYPTVTGLANLHHRLGFNPIAFNLFALTSLEYFFKQETYSLNFALFTIGILYFIKKIYDTYTQHGINAYLIFNSIFLYVLLMQSPGLSSPTSDFISAVCVLFIFLLLIEIRQSKKTVQLKTFVPILLLCAYSVMAKLSSLPVCIIFIYIFIVYANKLKQGFQILGMVFLITLPWFINTILLTGWLLYPFAAIDLFHFDWKVPTQIILQLNTEIVGWARSPNDFYYAVSQMPLSKWTPIWWKFLSLPVKGLIIGGVVSPILLCIAQLLKFTQHSRLLTVVVITSFSGMLFWFFTAPDFRFGQFFILFSLCTPMLYYNEDIRFFKTSSPLIKQALLCIIGCVFFIRLIRENSSIGTFNLLRVLIENPVIPKPIDSTPSTFTYVYMDTVKIYKPLSDNRCFDHKIPCTHVDLSLIRLRGTTLQNGFKSMPLTSNSNK